MTLLQLGRSLIVVMVASQVSLSGQSGPVRVDIPTMPNLPYFVAMARQCLRGGDTTAMWPLTVYEVGATP